MSTILSRGYSDGSSILVTINRFTVLGEERRVLRISTTYPRNDGIETDGIEISNSEAIDDLISVFAYMEGD